jgi:uncharacterized protein with PIN domain
MPTLVRCPHCLHPVVVPARSRGKGRLCRQCGQGYWVGSDEVRVHRLAASSLAELLKLASQGNRTSDPLT